MGGPLFSLPLILSVTDMSDKMSDNMPNRMSVRGDHWKKIIDCQRAMYMSSQLKNCRCIANKDIYIYMWICMYLCGLGNRLAAYLADCIPACTPKSGLGRGILQIQGTQVHILSSFCQTYERHQPVINPESQISRHCSHHSSDRPPLA